jgi:serine/threonine protein phosphatase PrpC
MLELEFGVATHAGMTRSENEDCTGYFIPKSRLESRSRGWLFVLADGVGGLDRGEVAAAMVVQVLVQGFADAPEYTTPASLLPRLIQHANAAVHDETLARVHRGRGMASTVVACALRHDQACVSHVGDSRCYLIRDGGVTALSRDHTIAADQLRQGLITAEEAAESETRHILSRSLGPELYISADTAKIKIRAGDILLLCSDGLCMGVNDKQIARILSQPRDPQALAEQLVTSALEADGSDNITAQVIAIRSVETMLRGWLLGRPGG